MNSTTHLLKALANCNAADMKLLCLISEKSFVGSYRELAELTTGKATNASNLHKRVHRLAEMGLLEVSSVGRDSYSTIIKLGKIFSENS